MHSLVARGASAMTLLEDVLVKAVYVHLGLVVVGTVLSRIATHYFGYELKRAAAWVASVGGDGEDDDESDTL